MWCDSEAGSVEFAKIGEENPLAGSGGASCLVSRLLVRLVVATARGRVSAVVEKSGALEWRSYPRPSSLAI